MITVLAWVVAGLAAALHVLVFVLESVLWRRPRVWRRFGVADQAAADTLRPMAYNQGFYNLFLAIATTVGIVLWAAGADVAGRTLVVVGLASMTAAALVLATTGRSYLRPAALQGTLPLVGLLLTLLA